MVGRPLSAYAYPNIWGHVREIGCEPSHRGLMRLRNNFGFRSPGLGNRTLSDKFNIAAPELVDHETIYEAIDLIAFHRQRTGQAPLNSTQEVLHFNHRIVNLPGYFPAQGNLNGSPIDVLAQNCSLPPCTVAGALAGRLVPFSIGLVIVQQAGGNADNLVPVKPCGKTPPLIDSGCLSRLLPMVATVPA